MKSLILLILTTIFLISCNIEHSPIKYGKDACNFCKMNIVDNQHAAEIVTKKGKPFKYDAIECMVEELKERDEKEITLFLITDYSAPGKLVDARTATYLISENIPSPMGANLSGFELSKNATEFMNKNGGKLYTWTELKGLF